MGKYDENRTTDWILIKNWDREEGGKEQVKKEKELRQGIKVSALEKITNIKYICIGMCIHIKETILLF